MVYCGKASLGCSSCRKRRIKCDKVKPECSQCVRLSKKCPGYRDQLSLMFRDETVKVERRVRASWGAGESPSASSSETATKACESRSAAASAISSREASQSRRPDSVQPANQAVQSSPSFTSPQPSMSSPVVTASADLGVSFYAQHYVLGYPDEPKSARDLLGQAWFTHPSGQSVMAAIGLGALANINGDKRLQYLAKEKYGEALVETGKALRDPVKNFHIAVKTVVMLALYQIVQSPHRIHHDLTIHIMGCAALIKGALPFERAPAMGMRGVLQLVYSLFIPCILSNQTFPSACVDAIKDDIPFMEPVEQPGVDLFFIITRLTNLIAAVRRTYLSDGRPATAAVIQELLELDADLDEWEVGQQGRWLYKVIRDESLPPEAAFCCCYHRYADIWTSRTWSYYRWARILTSQMIIEFLEKYPSSGAQLIPAAQRHLLYETIHRLAIDVLTSVPTHFKHPKMSQEQLDTVQSHGGAGAGSVGIPACLFHLQIAACAPGVPYDIWRWAQDTLETVWADMGMLHAKTLAEAMQNHRDRLVAAEG